MDTKTLSEDVTKALWSGHPEKAKERLRAAQQYVAEEIPKAEARVKELYELANMVRALSPADEGGSSTVQKRAQQAPSQLDQFGDAEKIDKDERNEKILELARRRANLTTDGTIKAKQLLKDVQEEGIEMGVSPSRVATAISNILLRTGGYENLGKGVWKSPE